MDDPTYADMHAFLMPYLTGDATAWDFEEAIYWYAHDHHGGQFTNLYEALCASPFKPGAYSTGLVDGSAALDLYMVLQMEYGGS